LIGHSGLVIGHSLLNGGMMTNAPYSILADSEDSTVKWIFGLVFLVIWAVSALMSMLAKKKEQERRERVRREIELGRSMPPSPVQQAPMQQSPRPIRPPTQQPRPPMQQPRPRPQPAPPRPAQARPAPQKQPKKRFPVKTPAARPSAPARVLQAEPAEAVILDASPFAPTTTAAKRPNAPSAAALHTWLKPATLRQQFILTEVLQPPVAMRDQHFGDF
jgi:hypothetical protein